MKTWQQLLGKVSSVGKAPFGPHTAAVSSAIHALQDAAWYRHVGAPSALDHTVQRVASWEAALAIFQDTASYVRAGVLAGPWTEAVRVQDARPELHESWHAALALCRETVDLESPSVPGATVETNVLLLDYLRDFVNLVLVEIIYTDEIRSTYFREQLQWFAAGYFPCGWVGEWPAGRMRVF